MVAKTYRPGEKVTIPGIVEIIGPRGGATGKERTVNPNEVFPPTPKPGQKFRYVRNSLVQNEWPIYPIPVLNSKTILAKAWTN